MLQRHKILGVDTSFSQQKVLLDCGTGQLKRLIAAAREFGQPVPVRMKLHCVVARIFGFCF